MPTTPLVDDELDPTELADQEDGHEEEEITTLVDGEANDGVDPDAEVVEEIDKVGVEEESSTSLKQKAHMIPRHLIDAPLTADDLFDDGSI